MGGFFLPVAGNTLGDRLVKYLETHVLTRCTNDYIFNIQTVPLEKNDQFYVIIIGLLLSYAIEKALPKLLPFFHPEPFRFSRAWHLFCCVWFWGRGF